MKMNRIINFDQPLNVGGIVDIAHQFGPIFKVLEIPCFPISRRTPVVGNNMLQRCHGAALIPALSLIGNGQEDYATLSQLHEPFLNRA